MLIKTTKHICIKLLSVVFEGHSDRNGKGERRGGEGGGGREGEGRKEDEY